MTKLDYEPRGTRRPSAWRSVFVESRLDRVMLCVVLIILAVPLVGFGLLLLLVVAYFGIMA